MYPSICFDPTMSSLSPQVFTQEVRTMFALASLPDAQSAGNLEQWFKTGRQLAKTSVTLLSWGGEQRGTGRSALWLGKAGKPVDWPSPIHALPTEGTWVQKPFPFWACYPHKFSFTELMGHRELFIACKRETKVPLSKINIPLFDTVFFFQIQIQNCIVMKWKPS